MKVRTAVFPGSFDPITNGHLDIVQRASQIFDQLVVAVGRNPEKAELFTAAERVEMIRELVSQMPNVRVASYEGLTVDFVRQINADIILRGIRDGVDLRDELYAANTNLIIGGVETVFLMASDKFSMTSSSFIKQIVSLGGDGASRLTALIPPMVLDRLRKKMREQPQE